MFITIIIGALGTVTKGLIKGLEDLEIMGWVETIQPTTLMRSAEYWEESGRLEKTCCHSNFNERRSANTNVKNSQGVKCKQTNDVASF